MTLNKFLGIAFVLFFTLIACKKELLNQDIGEYTLDLPAGNCSVNDETSYAFTYKINGLSSQQGLDFFVGNSFFNQNWVEAPSSTTARDGLGPLFNAKSCSSCHFRDGRGAPLFNAGLLLRLSTPFGDEPTYGGQFQNYSISTVQGEGTVNIDYFEVGGTYFDGTSYSLRHPNYSFSALNYGAMDPATMISPRIGPQMIGLGLLEIIPESSILAYEDPFDLDGDGISGKANYVFDPITNTTILGRFGWKANVGSLETQVAGAFNGDVGIKTSLHPTENYSSLQAGALAGLPDGGTIEIDDDDFAKVVLYTRAIAVPMRRGTDLAAINRGENIYNSISCVKCHQSTYKTGTTGNIEALKNVLIHPYTDLLLHDMGPELADNRPDGLANGNEWRTPPLWGLGLIQTVNSHTYLLHDGRARTIEEAILWHGGEAQNSKLQFKELSFYERSDLMAFLRSL